MIKFITVFIIFISLISPADAYLDPGSGGFILQMILGFIAAMITTFSLYWQKFKNLVQKILYKLKKKNKR
jgi:hypothetical protein